MPQQELVPVEEGPPKFALDNEEAIQACTRPYPLYKRIFGKKGRGLRMRNLKIGKQPIL